MLPLVLVRPVFSDLDTSFFRCITTNNKCRFLDPAAAYGTVVPPSLDLPDAVSNASSTIESEALLEECDPTITVCGTTANVKVVRTHNVTSYVTKYHVHEEITVCKQLSGG